MSEEKIKKISSIIENMGQVLFASVAIGPIMSGSFDWVVITSGLALSFGVWLLSVYLIK